ncbi:kelch motif family protein [Stylonychia lemnae]|uniref:Kelch motif family protein n=1 Tax=Stylonychia lemnae TaxID=5949 RepID=A0A078ADK8_STYLE|nr:kelch motif family protein [Stylonychia lemnae]|eukprot:CDW80319.1 kelch motif family protein [Stylonychia lemnae]
MELNLDNTCIFCDKSFNLEDRSPYFLPCNFHTSCKKCLNDAKNSKKPKISCPMDGTELELSQLKTLQKNAQIVNKLRQLEQSKKDNNDKWVQEIEVSQIEKDPEDNEENDQSNSAVLDISNLNISKRSKKKKKKKKKRSEQSMLQSMLQDPKQYLDQTNGLNPIVEESHEMTPAHTDTLSQRDPNFPSAIKGQQSPTHVQKMSSTNSLFQSQEIKLPLKNETNLRNNKIEPSLQQNIVTNNKQIEPRKSSEMIQGEGECKEHPGEEFRHLCLDHQKLLCPKCLMKHKQCEFQTSNEVFVFENKQRLRELIKDLNHGIQITQFQKSKIEIAYEEILNFKEHNIELIKFTFAQLAMELENRKQHLIFEVEQLVKDIEISLKTDQRIINEKEQKQTIWILQAKTIQGKIYEEYENVNKLEENLKKFSQINNTYQFFISSVYETPTQTFQINLDQMRYSIRQLGVFSHDKIAQNKPIIVNNQQNNLSAVSSARGRGKREERPRSQLDQQLQTSTITQQAFPSSQQQVAQIQKQQDRPVSSLKTTNKKLIWCKWGSYDAYKFDAKNDKWHPIEAKPNYPYLYFSSTVHLSNQRGALIIGGSDEDSNYYRRVLHFDRYQSFSEKNPMISKRAFFCSLHCQSTDQVFVFGGNEGSTDLNAVEVYDFQYNNWIGLPNMIEARNGASCVIFEKCQSIFIFGGANLDQGSLDTIEKFSIATQTWEVINVRLVRPMHDFVCHSIGKNRILILGQPDSIQNQNQNEDHQQSQRSMVQEVELQVIDLSYHLQNQCVIPKSLGQVYLPTFLDSAGFLYIFQGYLDSEPKLSVTNVQTLIQLNSKNFLELFDKKQQPLLQQ